MIFISIIIKNPGPPVGLLQTKELDIEIFKNYQEKTVKSREPWALNGWVGYCDFVLVWTLDWVYS